MRCAIGSAGAIGAGTTAIAAAGFFGMFRTIVRMRVLVLIVRMHLLKAE